MAPENQEVTTPTTGGEGRVLRDVMVQALTEFTELVGHEPESVTGVRPEDGGWSLLVDVVELERIPSTSSVLATYRVDADGDGHLRSYERLRRFTRNATDPM